MNPKKEILDDIENFKQNQQKIIYSSKKNKDKVVSHIYFILKTHRT